MTEVVYTSRFKQYCSIHFLSSISVTRIILKWFSKAYTKEWWVYCFLTGNLRGKNLGSSSTVYDVIIFDLITWVEGGMTSGT